VYKPFFWRQPDLSRERTDSIFMIEKWTKYEASMKEAQDYIQCLMLMDYPSTSEIKVKRSSDNSGSILTTRCQYLESRTSWEPPVLYIVFCSSDYRHGLYR
jgi:hypothetical protein